MALATLTVDFVAKLGSLERDLGKVAHLSEQGAARIDKFVGRIAAMGHTAVAGAALQQFASQVKSLIDSADELNDRAVRWSTTIQALASLELAAEQSGTSLDDVGSGLAKMAVAMVEHGAALKAAGVDATTAREAFYQFADIIKEMPSDAPETIELVRKVLGRSGDGLIPLLKLGSEGLREAETSATRYADAMAKLSPKADEFNDKLAHLKLSIKAAASERLLPHMDGLIEFIDRIDDAASGVDGLKRSLDALAKLLGADSLFYVPGSLSTIVALAERLYALRGGDGDQAKRSASGRISGAAPTAADWESFDRQTEEFMRNRAAVARARHLSDALGDNGKSSKSEGARLLEQLQERLVKEQELTEVKRLQTQIAEKLVKFDSPAQQTAALAIAAKLDAEKEWEAAVKSATAEAIKANDDWKKSNEAVAERLKSLYDATPSGKFDKLVADLQFAERAFNAGLIDQDKLDAISAGLFDVNADLKQTKSIGEEIGLTFTSAFEDAVVGGKKFSEILRALDQDIARLILRKTVTEPFADSASKAIKGSDFGSFFDGLFKTSNADGGVYASPSLSAYSGSIVSRPTYFRFARGAAIGEMGEAGPEAILPLQRGRNGKLGVAASGAGAGISIVVNQHIPIDARSDQASIRAAMVAAKEQAKAEILASMQRGGSFAR